ncbi:MAG: glycoside hydrolase family 57 protein [Nitrospira sp.]|nr:glycoside hydrolase family 57 protein [Nitrospira sp.]
MRHAYVCFLWHMHQPYYTDPVAGLASMPWVRLHATKAYYDMVHLLEQFPAVRATFNFTPSLLLQLQEIGEGAVRDLFLEHTQRPAADLTEEEQAFIIRHFFAANWSTMVRPYRRYHELLVKRGVDVRGQDLIKLARRFSTQDFLDLQVWHNLAWFGYGAIQRYPRLATLRNKNRGYTEQDKQEVLAIQRTVVQAIVPRYRALLERGQVEISTTPFFHPILPLVIDTEITKRARPDLPLPARFHAPEDASMQLRMAVDFHRRTFGRPPVGLWPSEGSVCPELLPLAHHVGLRWLATDEGILARSLEMEGRPWNRRSALYRPYRAGPPGQELTVLFRDRELSDAFGFVYYRTTPESAAEDVARRLAQIIQEAEQESIVVPIILDGENPWEHYHDGGERFLSLLYTMFSSRKLDQASDAVIQTSTVSEAIEAVPPVHHLSTLHSGSWINADFKIWIGHEEDNQAWNLLGYTRSRLAAVAPTLPPDRAEAARRELYAAEGSDWFWWYGDDFETDFKAEFDRLFRTHLRNVWRHMGLAPPDELDHPIIRFPLQSETDVVTKPVALLTPTIDGLVTDFFEWRGAGSINTRPPLGAMWKAEGPLAGIRYAWSREGFFLRFDFDQSAADRGRASQVEITIKSLSSTFRLTFSLEEPGPDHFVLTRSEGPDSWVEVGTYHSIGRKKILELMVPTKDLSLDAGQELSLSIVVLEHGLEVARYPRQWPAALTVPGPEFDAVCWRV